MSATGPLTALAIRYKSDKWGGHSYTKHYETHFRDFRDREANLLEIGIGGYEDPHAGGNSLRMWQDYFVKARIFALDFFDKSPHATDRMKIYQGSQDDAALLRRMNAEAGGFDIVIDDGSHRSEHVIASFTTLFPLLKSGGIYVVEDTQTSYWPGFGGDPHDRDALTTSMGFFKSLVHGLNHAEINDYQPNYFDLHIESIHFYHNLVFIYKGDNSEPSNMAADDAIRATGLRRPEHEIRALHEEHG
ncbi:class I SAM-dependent methyltransferase [Acidisoma silvae]|uniref:Class I SAM-dependent methyltransferase n=1 Tax=Acidisoma silvae TaxID=2802396 RepID=A0A964DZ32_9PROT|nr:class I SAM-dependent methyltransferase [Acidisoma silvae]MCB8875654.1 class I SAM-dependent methyltransferase [Acidisoma silvae]